MAPFKLLLALICFVANVLNALPALKHIEVADINRLSFGEKSSIFEPISILSLNQKTSEHNVHIFDKFGKFIRLNYHSQINAKHEVFELKPNGLNDLKSVQCVKDKSNTINLLFYTESAASKQANIIKSHIEKHEQNKYFLTGSHEWKCSNQNEQKNTPILRTIESVSIDPNNEKLLILTTKYAVYTDLFQKLDFSLQTNANMNHKEEDKSDKSVQPISRRKLLCAKNNINGRGLLCDDNPTNSAQGIWDDIVKFFLFHSMQMYDDILPIFVILLTLSFQIIGTFFPKKVNGVEELWQAVESVVSDIESFASEISDIYEDATELMDALTTGHYEKTVDSTLASWKYNYDGYGSASVLDLDAKVSCKDCYAFADLTYDIVINIDDYKLSYFKMTGTGDVKLNIDIEAAAEWKDEFSAQTCQISVPELGFSIAGIHFGFSIFGEFAVGLDVKMAFSYNIYATASITRGVEYDASTNTQNYIESQSFDHGSTGPVIDFNSASITVYGRATLYLQLSLVGNVHIGVLPKYVVSLSEDANYGASEGCAVDYTPSATMTIFVGASLNLAQKEAVWSKKANVATFSLPAGSSGCITHSDITSLEQWIDGIDSRRRLIAAVVAEEDVDAMDANTRFFVNYTQPNTMYQKETKWGKVGSLWNANLTVLESVCDSDDKSTAHFGELLVYPQSNDGNELIGIYKTIHCVSNSIISSNISCVSRFKFVQNMNEYASSNKIYRYVVDLMNDTRCDVDDAILNELNLSISLPESMNAILLSSDFETILLHDVNNCFVFPLTKNKKHIRHEFEVSDFEKFATNQFVWASKAWFGAFHCEERNYSDASTFYFNSIDWNNGNVNGTLVMSDGYKAIAKGQLNMTQKIIYLDFDLYDATIGDYILTVNGFVTVLQDGSVLFSGVTPKQPNCTGFVFQGYMNMDQFHKGESVDVIDNVDDDEYDENGMQIAKIVGFVCFGFVMALVLIMIALFFVMKCNGYKVVKSQNTKNQYGLMQDQSL